MRAFILTLCIISIFGMLAVSGMGEEGFSRALRGDIPEPDSSTPCGDPAMQKSCTSCVRNTHCVFCSSSSKCVHGSFYGPNDFFSCGDYKFLQCIVPGALFFYGGAMMVLASCLCVCMCVMVCCGCYLKRRRFERWASQQKTWKTKKAEELDDMMKKYGSRHPNTDSKRQELYEKYGSPAERARAGGASSQSFSRSRDRREGNRWK